MADKILNINDYRKRTPDEIADDIEIQDPYDFLDADEREEYIKNRAIQRQKEDQKIIDAANGRQSSREPDTSDYNDIKYEGDYNDDLGAESEDTFDENDYDESEADDLDFDESDFDEDENYSRKQKKRKEIKSRDNASRKPKQAATSTKRREASATHKKETVSKKHTINRDKEKMVSKKQEADKKSRVKAESQKAKEVRKRSREYEDDYDEDDIEDEKIERFVKIASFITGIIILILLAMIFKAKVYDTYFAADPDNATNVTTASIAGYIDADGTVVTTTNVNLRSTPSTDSDTFVVTQVSEGTTLTRTGVSEDGEWTRVEYEGQTLYLVTKYTKEE